MFCLAKSEGGVWVPKGTGASKWEPDFVVEEASELFFVEVKTFSSKIRPNQRWGLMNYPSMFIRYDWEWFARMGSYLGATTVPGMANGVSGDNGTRK